MAEKKGMRASFKSFITGNTGKTTTHSQSGYFVHSHALFQQQDASGYTSWAYAASTIIANRISGLKWHIENEKGEITNHKHTTLLSGNILKHMVLSLKIYGETYIYKLQTSTGKIISLHYINPSSITPQYNGSELVGYWVSGVAVPKKDMIIIRDANPLNTLGRMDSGYSPTIAAQSAINNEHSMQVRNTALMDNGAMPGMKIKLDGQPDQHDMEALKEQINDQYGNVNNRGKVMILSKGMEIDSAGMLTQKDMEYMEGMKWSRDKILATFGVPKAMLGMGDGVNVGNVKAFEEIFARNTIQPTIRLIEDGLSDQIFDGMRLVFDGVIPRDEDAIRNNYYAGAITKNEMRTALGYEPVTGGDIFIDDMVIEKEEKNTESDMYKAIKKGIQNATKGTEEYNEKRRSKSVKRMDEFEKSLKRPLTSIFEQQEKDILKRLEGRKSLKGANIALGSRFQYLYLQVLSPLYTKYMKKEGQIAMDEVIEGMSFSYNVQAMKKLRREQIQKVAQSVDEVTDKKLTKIIAEAGENGLTQAEIKEEVQSVFAEVKTSRINAIIRTESARIASLSQIAAREETDLVSEKERYTAKDERTCQYCAAMHGKKMGLSTPFFEKGDTLVGTRGGRIKLDYEDVQGAPCHPNCRCVLLSVLKEEE